MMRSILSYLILIQALIILAWLPFLIYRASCPKKEGQ